MTLQDASTIKIQVADEDRPDSLFMDQIKYQRFEKLNHRVTILTILIPILIGVIIFIGYRDIRDMVTRSQDYGAKELTNLAQSMDSTVSNIIVKQAGMEETLAAKVADQEKLEAKIQESLKKMDETVQESIRKMDTAVQDGIGKMDAALQGSLKKVESTVQESIKKTEISLVEMQEGKADKKEIDGRISGMESKMVQLQQEMKTTLDKMNADIKTFEKKVSDDLAKNGETINSVTTAVAECQADLVLISSEKEDKKAIEVSLKNLEKRFQDQIGQLTRNLDAKMESIHTSIAELGKMKSAGEKPAVPPPAKKP
jgi:hypothetical protein